MLMQAAIILAVVTPFSFDLHLGGVLVGVVILALFSVGVGCAVVRARAGLARTRSGCSGRSSRR